MTDGTTTWNYTYDANGMRTSRTNGTKTYNYVYNGSQLTQMTVGNDTLYFTYGVLGPTTVTWNGETYYYALNGQGDVEGIFDQNGNLVVFYFWENAWGYNSFVDGPLASTLGALNPLRYRSYVYDTETGYYYLQSRYYDPEIGRWINADGQISGVGGNVLGYNQFAYCFNNPVNMIDLTGNWPSWGQIFSAVATVAVAAVFVAAVVASAGAVGVAAGVAAASIGATGAMVGTAMTVGTVGTYVVAAGIGTCALSNAGEILTGTNIIRDGLLGGNQAAYDTVQTALNIAGGGAIIIGQTNPGVTGSAAKPSSNAQNVHKVPTTGTPNTSFDKLYEGNSGGFQRTYYDYNGNVSLQIDFTNHTTPLVHSNPHLHIWGPTGRGDPINLRYLER